jgi:putative sugar O-methyltransferase
MFIYDKLYFTLKVISKNVHFLLSRRLNDLYTKTLKIINDEQVYTIDPKDHEKSSWIAVNNYKIQKNENIKEIYKPGLMWDQILKTVRTYETWFKEKNDAVLQKALLRFYRTDLIFGHSGDTYIWEIRKGEIDLKLQVFMLITRYRQFLKGPLLINKDLISTTDVGHNIYTEYEGKKLTFKTIRHAYYLNQIQKFKLLAKDRPVVGELGCGAGEMAILTKKMYPGIRYVCFDLPETLMVSSYNIMMTFPDKKIGLYEDFRNNGKITREDINPYDIILLPNWCIEWFDTATFDLFINIGSLSEMDLPIIENYIRTIERICHGYFYTVNRNVGNVREFGASDIPVEDFPFSENAKITHVAYDIASDIFHSSYGMNYRCNYWEYVFSLNNNKH